MSTNADSAGAIALSHSRERPASTQNGFLMLFVLLLLLVAIVLDFGWLANSAGKGGNPAAAAVVTGPAGDDVPVHSGRLLSAPAQPGRRDPAVRRL